jgi:hypothetical protein
MSFATDYGMPDLAAAAAKARSRHSPYGYMNNPTFDPGVGGKVLPPPTPVGGGGGGGGGGPVGGPLGSITIPGPDYTSLIESSPEYQSWLQSSTQNLANAATQRKAALRALVLQYGGLPAGVSDSYGDLGAGDMQAGRDNPYSQVALLKRTYDQNVNDMKRGLAARGALHSGDLGYGQAQLDTAKGQSEYDLGNQFASALQAAIGQYLGVVGQENQNRAGAVGQAYQNLIQNPLYQQGAGGQAQLVSDWQTKYGKPVYQDGVGNLYTVDGNGTPIPYFGS